VSIAGSDSGGGAGVQADLKAITAFGVHAATVITAITAQNSREVTEVLTLPDSIVAAQIDAVMSDFQPRVVKLGMLGNERMVLLVARKLREWKPEIIVLDPVMIASSGAALLEPAAVEALRSELLPMATLVTPNWSEAGALIDAFPRGLEDIPRIVTALRGLGARDILIKGGHLEGDEVVDTLFSGGESIEFRHARIRGAEAHGTGCALASATAADLALGQSMVEACGHAIEFVYRALRSRYATGGSKENYLWLKPNAT
jgi:hydroxymethylpyrimidine/phosphomethylpyrimidine kinase